MYIKILFGIFLLTSLSCQVKRDSSHQKNERENDSFILFPDSLFKYSNIKRLSNGIVAQDLNNGVKYKLLDLKDRSLLTDSISQIKDISPKYNAYYFSKFPIVGEKILPIVLYINSNNYSSLILITTERRKMVDYIEITKKESNLVRQDDAKEVIWINEKTTEFIDNNQFQILNIEGYLDCYSNDTIFRIDTTSTNYMICENGSIMKK